MLRSMHTQLGPFVCFACRKSFKRPFELDAPPCPDCGEATVGLSEKFQAPPKKDVKAWRVVEFLVENGFRFASIWERDERGLCLHVPGAYPRTMDEAKEFVVRYAAHRVDRRG